MTYSIVARDARTGELGVGVQTHQPCVGAIVPWVRAGVGAVATQSFANPRFGPQALALLEHGLPAEHALAAVLAGDSRPEVRQVAVVDAAGRAAAHTGSSCIPHAGHIVGDSYSVQANMMARDTVPDAMAAAFEGADGLLAERIFAALEAAEAEGGDIRGSQSAAILVRSSTDASDYHWDLRVDDDPDPIARLRTLVHIRLAGREERRLEDGASALSDDPGERAQLAWQAFERARAFHSSDEQTFWFALDALVPLGQLDAAGELLGPLFARAPQWRELLQRLDLPTAAELRRHLDK